MTRLNYSNLPPEAQDAIKKLTGYSDEELNGEKAKQPKAKPAKTHQAKPQIFRKLSKQAVALLIFMLAFLLLAWLVNFIATSC